MAAFRRALKSLVSAADADYSKLHPEFFVGLEVREVSRQIISEILSA